MKGLLSAAACLPAGFGVAVASGVRPLGGIVLLALALLAARWSGRTAGRRARWLLVVFVCFVVSHLLGLLIGAWGAVAVVTAIAAAAHAWMLGSFPIGRAREKEVDPRAGTSPAQGGLLLEQGGTQ